MSAAQLNIFPGVNSVVAVAGQPVVAVHGYVVGAIITNPASALDQGLTAAEILWVDPAKPAVLGGSATTFPLLPGQSFKAAPNSTVPITVTAASDGHQFAVVVMQPAQPYTPPIPGPFPPSGPTTVLDIIPSYLYQEYNDDDDLQAFVDSYNSLAQQYLDWLNNTNLPVYTAPTITGPLLDWVAQGLYGIARPALSSGLNNYIGPYNTWLLNQIPLDARIVVGPSNVVATSDDIYKRIITWNYWKGDGRVFNVRWLKRRIMRFLLGTNGSAPLINNTWQISVSFGLGNTVSIRLLTETRMITSGAIYNGFQYNSVPFNSWQTSAIFYPPLPNAEIFVEAINAGVLQTPFQYTFVATA